MRKEIVRRTESLFALADQLEARLATAQGQEDKLTPPPGQRLPRRSRPPKTLPKNMPANRQPTNPEMKLIKPQKLPPTTLKLFGRRIAARATWDELALAAVVRA